jgi:transposase
LQQIPGIGPVISTALTYMIADPKVYKNGRQCAAALGLTPKEHSSGGKQHLGSISGEGNSYLRKILVQGAQSVLRRAPKRQNEPLMKWVSQLKMRKSNNLAAVALANKIVRIAWAMLVNQSDFAYKRAV